MPHGSRVQNASGFGEAGSFLPVCRQRLTSLLVSTIAIPAKRKTLRRVSLISVAVILSNDATFAAANPFARASAIIPAPANPTRRLEGEDAADIVTVLMRTLPRNVRAVRAEAALLLDKADGRRPVERLRSEVTESDELTDNRPVMLMSRHPLQRLRQFPFSLLAGADSLSAAAFSPLLTIARASSSWDIFRNLCA